MKEALLFVDGIDTPVRRMGGWSSPRCAARKRLAYYAKAMSEIGISNDQIACMFSDILWDSHDELDKVEGWL